MREPSPDTPPARPAAPGRQARHAAGSAGSARSGSRVARDDPRDHADLFRVNPHRQCAKTYTAPPPMAQLADRPTATGEARTRWRTPDLARDIDAGAYLETLVVAA